MTKMSDGVSVCGYLDHLAVWYELETGGAIVGSHLERMYGDTRQGAIFSLIRSLEERTANWIKSILVSHNRQPMLRTDLDVAMIQRAQDMFSKKWEILVRDLHGVFEEWVVKLRESEQNIPAQFVRISKHLIRHEEALAEFARLEAAGEYARSTNGIRVLLSESFETECGSL